MKRDRELNKSNLRRGFTLMELVIVMALMTVVSGMIVSFSVLMSKQLGTNGTRSNYMDSVIAIKNDLTVKFSENDEKDKTFTVETENEGIKISRQGVEDIIITPSDYRDVDEIKFDIIEGNTSLLKIKVINTELGAEQTFTLSSRTGASFQITP